MQPQAFELLKSTLDEIRSDMRTMRSDISENNTILIRNTMSLEDHVMRTNLLQTQVANLQKMVVLFEQKMTHIDAHVSNVEGILSAFKPTPKKIGLLVSAITAMLTFFTSIGDFVIKVVHGLFK